MPSSEESRAVVIINYPKNQKFDTQCHHNNRKAGRHLPSKRILNCSVWKLELRVFFFFFVIEGGKIDFVLLWFWFFGYLWGKKKYGWKVSLD